MNNKIIPNDLNWTEGKVKNFFGKGLLDLKNGSVKLVKINAGAEYPLHIHPDKTEYIFVVQGELSCTIGEEKCKGKVGDFFIFPQNIFHALANHSQHECIVLVGAIKI